MYITHAFVAKKVNNKAKQDTKNRKLDVGKRRVVFKVNIGG